ncbi:MAG: ABC transporter ATP-binding protein [Clostridiales bacterium]|nr:ABC transporter ATP-binding protein [Clostridiales bacterium]MDY4172927.1 ABC transporter ATP-binding protein [Evtepia sp.]
MDLLEVKSLSKTYGSGETAVHALKNVSFSVPKGEFVAIVGESGSGKTTLLNMLGALDTPTSGKVLIDGKDTFAMKEKALTVFRRRNIGFIFQSFNLIPELTVEQNMIFPVLLDYQKPNKRYLEELLTVLNLGQRRHHLPSQLSGGQQQRVAIGRALMTRPALILADEPTGNLDSQNSSEVIALLKAASQNYEQTILMITHNRSIAQAADRVLNVSDGVLTDLGRCRE